MKFATTFSLTCASLAAASPVLNNVEQPKEELAKRWIQFGNESRITTAFSTIIGNPTTLEEPIPATTTSLVYPEETLQSSIVQETTLLVSDIIPPQTSALTTILSVASSQQTTPSLGPIPTTQSSSVLASSKVTTPATTVKPGLTTSKTTILPPRPTSTPPVRPPRPTPEEVAAEVIKNVQNMLQNLRDDLKKLGQKINKDIAAIIGRPRFPFWKREDGEDFSVDFSNATTEEIEEQLSVLVTNVFAHLIVLTNNTNVSLAESLLTALEL